MTDLSPPEPTAQVDYNPLPLDDRAVCRSEKRQRQFLVVKATNMSSKLQIKHWISVKYGTFNVSYEWKHLMTFGVFKTRNKASLVTAYCYSSLFLLLL